MSIYIHGMEMPTKENTVILISPNGDVWMIGDMPNEDTHLAKAKAIPVPPHGRCIDADAVSLKDGPYEYDEWCEWALRQYQDAPTIIPADDSKLSATIKCGSDSGVTCAVAYNEEVYKEYVDTAGNLRWTGTHSGEHIVRAEEDE